MHGRAGWRQMADARTHHRRRDRHARRCRLVEHGRRGCLVLRDPGVQYDSTINKWHTCSNTGKINASNPCSEYMFLDDTACNLSSLNLTKFLDEQGNFDIPGYRHAIDVFFLAQEILVDLSSYPTDRIAKNSHDFRRSVSAMRTWARP